MAKIAVSLKIDVTKIDRNRLFNGQKGIYLDATAFIDLDELDQYGNSGMITQDVSKEERAQGVKGSILGNSKVFWKEGLQQQAPQQNQGYQNQRYQEPAPQAANYNQQTQSQQQPQNQQQAPQQPNYNRQASLSAPPQGQYPANSVPQPSGGDDFDLDVPF